MLQGAIEGLLLHTEGGEKGELCVFRAKQTNKQTIPYTKQEKVSSEPGRLEPLHFSEDPIEPVPAE